MKQYPITFWYGIRPEYLSKERLLEAKEAGFNIIECIYDPETNKKVLRWCEELGLKANVGDPRIGQALAGKEGWEALLDTVIADYAAYPAVNRFFIKDEPLDDYFPTLGRVAAHRIAVFNPFSSSTILRMVPLPHRGRQGNEPTPLGNGTTGNRPTILSDTSTPNHCFQLILGDL